MADDAMNIQEIATAIDAQIRALPVQDTASIRDVRRRYSKRLASATPAKVIELARQLLPRYRWLAYELVHHHRGAMQKIGALELRLLGQGMASWDAVDTFGDTDNLNRQDAENAKELILKTLGEPDGLAVHNHYRETEQRTICHQESLSAAASICFTAVTLPSWNQPPRTAIYTLP